LFRLRQPEETAAWNRFVDLYTPLLFHWARQLRQQASDSADLVQDVLMILWQKLPEFEYDSGRSFHAWLKTLFLNRHRSRQRARGLVALEVVGDHQAAESDGGLVDPVDARYLIRQAFRLIEREFSPLYQQAFRAYVLEEKDSEVVAAELGITVVSVYAIKSRILRRLRQELQQLLD
jgi:RNA polymerase sigma-70 factor (ECF subfamily)